MKHKIRKLKILIIAIVTTIFNTVNSYAANDGETQFNNVLSWILGWVVKIGIVIAIWGAIQIAMSFSTEDAGQRRKGILEFISGLMVMAIGFGSKTIIGY